MSFLYRCTTLYGPWFMGVCQVVYSMGHGKKVAEGVHKPGMLIMVTRWQPPREMLTPYASQRALARRLQSVVHQSRRWCTSLENITKPVSVPTNPPTRWNEGSEKRLMDGYLSNSSSAVISGPLHVLGLRNTVNRQVSVWLISSKLSNQMSSNLHVVETTMQPTQRDQPVPIEPESTVNLWSCMP